MPMMVQRHYTVRFLTPAFLGDAEQNGAWRTPPFKALLRQWWRVAIGADCKNVQGKPYDVDELKRREAALFGTASDGESSKSAIRIRLSHWGQGTLGTLPGNDPQVTQPEVTDQKTNQIRPIGSSLYLGFGPISGNAIKNGGHAIDPNKDSATFSLAYPREHDTAIRKTLWLMDRYGTLGGRSRNGWGSALFTEISKANETAYSGALGNCARDWAQCLNEDWAHAVGSEMGRPLIWETPPKATWRELMKTLAQIKIGLRTQFSFTTGRSAPRTEDRHWLSYPVTNHSVGAWGNNARLPNTLRFKARLADDGTSLVGVILHVPCKPPAAFNPDTAAITRVWTDVHSFLNELTTNTTRHYPSTISNAAVIASLNALTLKRIPA